MVSLYKNEEKEPFAKITENQLQFLEDELEEESTTDQDYAITALTLGLFVEDGGDPELIRILQQALGEKDEITIRWEKDAS